MAGGSQASASVQADMLLVSGLFPEAAIMTGGGYPDDVFPKVGERSQSASSYRQMQGVTGQGSCGGQKLGLAPSSFGFTHA